MQVENVKAAAAGKEAELNSKLEDHAHEVKDRNALTEQVLQLQKELQLAQTTITEQVTNLLMIFLFSIDFFSNPHKLFQTAYDVMTELLLVNILTKSACYRTDLI